MGMITNEIWKDIPNYEGLYQVSNLGRVKSLQYNHTKKEKILSPRITGNGHLSVALFKNKQRKNYQVHRLVMKTFVGDSVLVVNHKDKNKENNKLDNLEYCTQKENVKYSLNKKVLQYDLKNNFIKEWNSIKEIIDTLHIRNISQCCGKKRNTAGGFIWKYKEVC